jgi:hypothetical protein
MIHALTRTRQESLASGSTRWETRRLTETVDIPARIAELQSVLLETRSEDVRQMIEGAIEDCQQRLAELEEAPDP